MSKVGIIWFNFSLSTSSNGPVSSGLSLLTADLVDTNIGRPHSICNCGGLRKRSINVTNRRNTYLAIKDVKTHDALNIEIFYRLLKQTIKEYYQTFDFEGQNMAVLIDEGERFDDLKILEAFKVKLGEFYQFSAPIDMERVSAIATDEQEVDAIPFMNKEDGNIKEFVQWVHSVCPQ